METQVLQQSNQASEPAQLILNHRALAQNVARKLSRNHFLRAVDYEEIESAAMLGLCEAAGRYCADSGTPFGTFAYLRIRGAVYDMLRRQRMAPLSAVEETLGIRLYGDGDTFQPTYREDWTAEEAAARTITRRHIRRLLGELPDEERRLVELYYYEGLSLTEVRDRFPGRSKCWISRLHARAIDRLRSLAAG